MIIRLSESLNSKINGGSLRQAPPDANPYADWTARLFRADRTQYILITHTTSLYSVVIYGRGITYDGQFICRVLDSVREFMADDGLELIYTNFIIPSTGSVLFSKPLNRANSKLIDKLEAIAKDYLKSDERAPFDIGTKLNGIPLSTLGDKNADGILTPRDAFKALGSVDAEEIARQDRAAGERDVSAPDDELRKMLEEVPERYHACWGELVSITDAFCDEHLNAEYRGFGRKMAVAVCQDGWPTLRGMPESWAAGIVHALGQVNFLTDPSQQPHMRTEEIAKEFGVSVGTMHAKAKVIREGLELFPFHPNWSLPSLADQNPLIWMLEVDGIAMDIRNAPRGTQVAAYEEGLIPYIPADRVGATDRTPRTVDPNAAMQLYEIEIGLISGPMTEAFVEKNPAVVRVIQIRGDQTLADLHAAIFDAFERYDEHMYEFQIGGDGPMDPNARRYVLPMAMNNPLDDAKPAGEVTTTAIAELGLQIDEPFGYWFDFGDDWWHELAVVAIHDEIPRGKYPKVIKKAGESPPQYIDWDEEGEGDEDDD